MTRPPLADLPRVPAADVYKQGRLCAGLRRTAQGIEFRYTDEYLERPGPAPARTSRVTC